MTEPPRSSKPQLPAANARLTMADIARLADVSASTVSRALAGNARIPLKMRKKIETIAREHGYVINQAARHLRMQTTQTIGIVLPSGHETGQEINDPFVLEFIGHLAEKIVDRGYEILLSKHKAPDSDWLTQLIRGNRMDGVIVLGQSDQHEVIETVAESYYPMVVWGEKRARQNYCSVGVDNVEGGRVATEHLLARGRKNIRFMGLLSLPEFEARYNGYLQAMQASGLPPERLAPIPCRSNHEFAQVAMRGLMASGEPVDAVFAATDVIAHGAKTVFRRSGGRVPDDCAFVGFDDITLAKYLEPPLTTVRQDLSLGAQTLVGLLFRRMNGEETESVSLPARLILRETS